MKASKDQGGLKLFDLEKKDRSLKIQWINVYFKNKEIRTLANTYIQGEVTIWLNGLVF